MTIDKPTQAQVPGLRQLWQEAFGDSPAAVSEFFRSFPNCISYVAELADHFGDKEYAAEIRDRFNSLLGVEEEPAS